MCGGGGEGEVCVCVGGVGGGGSGCGENVRVTLLCNHTSALLPGACTNLSSPPLSFLCVSYPPLLHREEFVQQ